MFTMFAAISIFEIVMFSAFLIFLIFGTFLDDTSDASFVKWTVIFLGFAVFGIFYWSEWTFESIFSTLISSSFISDALTYLGIGIFFAIAKFFIEIKKSANYFSERWKRFKNDYVITTKFTNDLMNDALQTFMDSDKRVENLPFGKFIDFANYVKQNTSLNSLAKFDLYAFHCRGVINDAIETFAKHTSRDYSLLGKKFILMVSDIDKQTPAPYINKSKLSGFISAWTILWPFYLIVMVLGDVIANIFSWITDIINALSFKMVAKIFESAFK